MLKLSKDVNMTDIVSDGDGSNPVSTQHPISGSSETLQLFLFNTRDAAESTDKRYEDVTIEAVDTSGSDESGWIEFAVDEGGSPGTFQAGPLSLGNIDDLDVAHPFWIRVTTPQVEETQNKSDIELEVSGTEFAV